MSTVYFFKHGLDEQPMRDGRLIPGRYAHSVQGNALYRTGGTSFEPRSFAGVIYADSYRSGRAPNMDPCVLSDVLPWFLSYCRIDARKTRHLVPGTNQLLSEAVTEGDVIVFGNLMEEQNDAIFVDTVLCVSGKLVIPQSAGYLEIETNYDQYRAGYVGLPDAWESFAATRAYELNLRDSATGRGHHRARIDPHLQIVGRRGGCIATTRDELAVKFLGGEGFNLVPLIDDAQCEVRSGRPGMLVKAYTGATSILTSNVTRLAATEAERLIHLILEADVLVLDPVKEIAP